MPWPLSVSALAGTGTLLPAIAIAVAVLLGLATLFYAALPWLIQPLLRLVLALRYRYRVRGLENLPRRGPVMLVANHVTWLDGFHLAAVCPRRGKALVNASYTRNPILRALARRAGMILVPVTGPKAHRAAIAAARATLERGEALALFPEAQLTRTGFLGSLYRGIEIILEGRADVPVLPIALDNLWGSVFSFSRGRFFHKPVEGWRRVVCVAIGPPIPPPTTLFRIRMALMETGVRAFELREGPIRALETLDLSLPHWTHPQLGLLTASAHNIDQGAIRQTGQRPGTRGHPVPGVAVRVVDDSGQPLRENTEGRLQALIPGRPEWIDTGARGRMDEDGFVTVREEEASAATPTDKGS